MMVSCLPLLAALLLSLPGAASADWRQDVRLAVANKGLSMSRFPPFGFHCSKSGKQEDDCQCWGTDGRAFPYQVSGDPCRVPGGCLATDCGTSGADWKYGEAGDVNGMLQQLSAWKIGGNIVTYMQKNAKKKSSSFKVPVSESGCSGEPGKKADCNVWIGAVRNNDGVVQFGVAKAQSECELKKVYTTKKCENPSGRGGESENDTDKRKFTSQEKDIIKQNMQSAAYKAAAQKAYPQSLSAEERRRLSNETHNETFLNAQGDQ